MRQSQIVREVEIMSKIAVVGCQASGKTVFMAALADYYRPNQRVNQLCCMTPENANANRFSEVMIHQMRDLHEWPSATNAQRTMSLKWAMRRGSEIIAQIEMLDFGGEVFRAAFRDDEGTPQNQDAVRQLVDYLVDANFIVVLVSLAELSRDINRTATDRDVVLDAESKWVTRGLLDLLKEHQTSGSKVIVALTQADRPEHKRMLETYGGPKGVFEKAWPIVSAVYPEVKVISVASVSNTTMDNRPADGFKTDGVLSVMKEFSQYQFGDCDGISQRLAATAASLQSMSAISSPAAFTCKLNEFDSLLTKLYKETAVIAELYKTDFQNCERLKSTCLEFVNVIEEVERRPLDSQVNGAFWREQEQLYPILSGTIRSFERYYQRKVEQQKEELRKAEEAAAQAAEQFKSAVKEVTDDAENLSSPCFCSRSELERDIVSLENKVKNIERSYVVPGEVKCTLSELKAQLKGLRSFLTLFDDVERKIVEKCGSEDEWRIFWESANSKYSNYKSFVDRVQDLFSGRISDVVNDVERAKQAERVIEANAKRHSARVRAFITCLIVVLTLFVIIGASGYLYVTDRERHRAAEARQKCLDSLSSQERMAAITAEDRRKIAELSQQAAQDKAKAARLAADKAKYEAETAEAKRKSKELECARQKEESLQRDRDVAQKEIDGLRSAIAEESESNIRTSLQKLAVIPLDTLQAKVKSEGESFLNHLVGANSRNVSDAIWLGECYAHGGCDLVPIDNDKAYKWYKEAASTGDGTALLYLAECLEKGIGCVADKKEAVNYYDRARRADCDMAILEKICRRGAAVAMFEYAFFAERGLGAPKDADKAYEWYLKSASSRNGDAMYRLAVNFAEKVTNGDLGLKRSNARSYTLFMAAKKHGCVITNDAHIDTWIEITKGSGSFYLDDLLRKLETERK